MNGINDKFDFLKNKVVPGPPKSFIVRVADIEAKKEGEPRSKADLEAGLKADLKTAQIKIVDKRGKINYNRELVLERLNLMVSKAQPLFKAPISERPKDKAPIYKDISIISEESEDKESEDKGPITKGPVVKKRIIIGETIVEPLGENIIPEAAGVTDKALAKAKNKDEAAEAPVKRRYTKRRTPGVIDENINLDLVVFENEKLGDMIPKKNDKMIIRASSYYMNNRLLFGKKLYDLFKPRRAQLDKSKDENVSCEKRSSEDFKLLIHQEVVRDYLNVYSPYRGLLLFHGLGSGKTCTSIAIAEGMKTDKQIIIMTPASLKMNYFSELKKCGDDLYRKNQYWEFITPEKVVDYVAPLAKAMSLDPEYIQRKGVWLVNVKKPSNFEELTSVQKSEIDAQLDIMISAKYSYINYKGGLDKEKLEALTSGFTINPFDNKVVVIDEVHNLVSRIVNKLKDHDSVSYRLYEYLMSASNVKLVFLSGTPIINYPNEIGILFNMLRGYIKTWNFPIVSKSEKKINTASILKMFEEENFKTYDYINYSGNNLVITRNPFGFVNVNKRGYRGGDKKNENKAKVVNKNVDKTKTNNNKEDPNPLNIGVQDAYNNDKENSNPYEGGAKAAAEEGAKAADDEEDISEKYGGVVLNPEGNISDDEFKTKILDILRKNKLEVVASNITITNNKALPDDTDTFLTMFVNPDTGVLQNIDLFKRRVLGLTSYFKSAQESLLPKFNKLTDKIIERIPMSDHQFSLYAKARKDERDREKKQKKQNRMVDKNLFKTASSYRVFSRALCNFSFPDDITRPMKINKSFGEKSGSEEEEPDAKEIDENEFDAISVDEDTGVESADPDTQYANEIKAALRKLKEESQEYLSKDGLEQYSPKMLQILENIEDEENVGLHLVYSQFRALEGIGIFKMVLEQNGFAEFKLIKNADREWDIQDIKPGDEAKPKFVLYTGTETIDEKELIRHIYNSNWENLSIPLRNKLRAIHENNFMGEIIKVFMITSSGAEGINLENTRFVHIMEPYWNPVRVEQVIGRARRICSHKNLPEELRTVRVHLYLSSFTEEQMKSEKNIDIRINDVSRIDRKTPVSTDEYLFELSNTKETITRQILTATKESAMDCSLYNKSDSDEPLVCYNFGKVSSNNFASIPDLEQDTTKNTATKEKIKGRKVTIESHDYILKTGTKELYDYYPPYDFAGHLEMDEKTKRALIRI
jgi:hypothetical protein